MTAPQIRVMIVDDSVVVRRAIASALEAERDFVVVATAANGQLALTRLETTQVDAVILDIEMPEMDGLETLRRIRAKWTHLPVIMCSTLTERGAAVTIDALAAGATDYVTKPAASASYAASLGALREELVTMIRGVVPQPGRKHAARPGGSGTSTPGGVRTSTPGGIRTLSSGEFRAQTPASVRGSMVSAPKIAIPGSAKASGAGITLATRPIEAVPHVLAIASSTGGPNALLELWKMLPKPFPVPVVMVQHMPPIFTRMLAERLTATPGITVREGAHGEPLVPGEARMAPGGFHMELTGTKDAPVIRIQSEAPENSCRPAADVLFRSVARIYGGRVLGVVLTGMGQDGLVGSQAIVDAGGSIIAQDEATSVVWGMPGFVARAGLAREVLPISEIAGAISRVFRLTSASKGRDEHRRERLPVRA